MHRKHELERLILENDEELFPEKHPQDRAFGELESEGHLESLCAKRGNGTRPHNAEVLLEGLVAEPTNVSPPASRAGKLPKEQPNSALTVSSRNARRGVNTTLPPNVKKSNWLRRFLVGGLLLLAACLAWNARPGGHPVASPAAVAQQTRIIKPIEQIRVGDVAEVNLPPEALEEALGDDTEYDSATWQRIKLRMQKPDGSLLHMELLRPNDWVDFYEAKVGQHIELSIPELGAEGLAEVLEIGPSPVVDAGRGRVVTGTFKHESAEVLDLTLSDGTTIGTTAMHPFWSVDRQTFVEAGQLKCLERLLTFDGSNRTVHRLIPREGAVSVYNLEINRCHIYHVAEQGLLVHNAYPDGNIAPNKVPDFSELGDGVLLRIRRGDAKGRPFGTPRNPRSPTLEEFNPRLHEVRAGDLESSIASRKHGLFPEQQEAISRLSNEELLQFRPNDPISASGSAGLLALTGGHHRTAEIARRVASGQLSPDTIVRILLHD